MTLQTPPELFGRRAEIAAVESLVGRVRAGHGGVLVLTAQPGLGRTALVEYARGICGPVPAVRAAVPSRFAYEGGGPRLVCVDDVHRWDHATRAALAADLRRAPASTPMAVLLTYTEHRIGAGEFAGHTTLRLGPLDDGAAASLLDRLTLGAADPVVGAWLVREATGNPRLLTALVAALTPGQLTGRSPLPDPLPGGEDLLADHALRVDDLPGPARALLLLAAAAGEHEPDGAGADLALVLRAGGDPAGLAPAEAAGVVVAAGGRLRFTHPLLRRAVLRRVAPDRRGAAHLRLAHACRDRLPRLIQLACAADDHDARLAASLAAAAAAHRPHAERSAALARAAALTAAPETRTDRLADAAEAARLAGDPVRARALLSRAGTVPAHGGVHRVRGLLALADGPADDARESLLTAAALLPPARARRALIGAAEAAWSMGDAAAYRDALTRLPPCDDDPLLEAYRTGMCAVLAGHTTEGHASLRRCLAGLRGAGLAERAGEAAGQGEEADGVRADALHAEEDGLCGAGQTGEADVAGVLGGPLHARATGFDAARQAGEAGGAGGFMRAGAAALVVGEVEVACEAGARALAAVRAYGPEVLLPRALEHLAYGELRAGRHTSARAHALEGLRAAHRIGQTNVAVSLHAVLALAASVEGDADACAAHAAAAAAGAGPHGLAQAATLAVWAVARTELATGRPADAAARLAPLVAPGPRRGHFAVRLLAVPCFVEAAVQVGRVAEARRATAEFTRWAGATADGLASAQLARCRALLAPPVKAAAAFASAVAHHDRLPGEFERGRTQLLYGQWLRRRRRTREARGPLRDALVSFERCGARAWADRSRAELRAAGEAVGGERSPGPLSALTPQQQRIARHVAEGATNREVAVRLSVSHRTVDHHLRNVFAALGVRSRVELSRLLAGEGGTGVVTVG
ncbi:LuxR family transcriptional regulator [Streptomyces venezuelae]|uniref:LuxR family transcriptional regulator n=1 Tax=Streptomyces venezuelae TaxID=54571 RepID=A0A5P2CD37_STRVZ|nr:LuxR C-terminal-related transcriptional regulator [Streptomyces venezuelae]QES39708.1 LuxR family transcriptional regulator [Streptomyces venezuelae]